MRLMILLAFLAAPLSAQKPDTLRVPLTAWQRAQFASYDSTLAQLQHAASEVKDRQALFLTALVSVIRDPRELTNWDVVLRDSAIVLTRRVAKDTVKVKIP